MKTLKLCIPILSLALLASACRGPRGAVRTTPLRDRTDVGLQHTQDSRIDGQRASEAGLQEDRWHVQKKTEVAAETPPAKGQSTTLLPARQVEPPAVAQPSAAAPSPQHDAELELRCEELVIGTRMVDNGAVYIRKVVNTKNASQTVPLKREEYVVERLQTDRQYRDDPRAFSGQEIIIPLTREEAVAGKRSFVNEIVRVRKTVETDQKTVSGDVRCETVEVSRKP